MEKKNRPNGQGTKARLITVVFAKFSVDKFYSRNCLSGWFKHPTVELAHQKAAAHANLK
jgi:hypothetical protein